MELEQVIEKDDIDTLKTIDMTFNSSWTETAVKCKAYKCFQYLLDIGTELSQYSFLRAVENNSIDFFERYGKLLVNTSIKYECIENAFERDFHNLFIFLVKQNVEDKKMIQRVIKMVTLDTLSDMRETDYITALYWIPGVEFKEEQLIKRPHFLDGKISRKTLTLLILNRIVTSNEFIVYPKSLFFDKEGYDDIIDFYSKRVYITDSISKYKKSLKK